MSAVEIEDEGEMAEFKKGDAKTPRTIKEKKPEEEDVSGNK